MNYVTFLFVILTLQVNAQQFTEYELKTDIKEATIFLEGGLVSRVGNLEISKGKSSLRITALSPYIDNKSIQVKATGNFTILSVGHKFNYLNQLEKDAKVTQLNEELEKVQTQIFQHEARLQILKEKRSVLDANKNLNGENSGASLAEIKAAIEFYDQELTAIKFEELQKKQQIQILKDKEERLAKELTDTQKKEELPTSEIEIKIDAAQKTEGAFIITYLVANTGWYPKYDVRVKSVEKPLKLTYKADIYQNTGVDWENVNLKLSNGNPNQSGVAPELATWYLNYSRNTIFSKNQSGVTSSNIRNVSGKIVDEEGESLPGISVVVKGTTIGTTTDLEGNYSLTLPNGAAYLEISFIGYVTQQLPIVSSKMNVRLEYDLEQLEEVVVVGYGVSNSLQGRVAGVSNRSRSSIKKAKVKTITTTTIENQTTVEFEVDEPYSIKSNGEKLSVDVKQFEIETIYEYYAVPKLDKDAFLIAKIINWDQYNLLEGEANLYFEDAYVGRSILDGTSLADTLEISLGRDKSIVIGREKSDEFVKRRTIGGNKLEIRSFKVLARNKKSQAIRLTLFDQIPVSAINEITVSPTELSGGKLDEKTGEILWQLNLQPQQQTELIMSYEVKYPKRERVILE